MPENKSNDSSPLNTTKQDAVNQAEQKNTQSESFLKSAANKIGDAASSTVNAAKEVFNGVKDSASVSGYMVEEIGRPFRFAENVDPINRTYNFLSTRMNILDMYPCNYGQVYTYNSEEKKSLFKYGVTYEHAMSRYRKLCANYFSVSTAPSALRLFLTDDTVVTDGISTTYKENFFQTMANRMSNAAQTFTDLGRSLNSTQYDKVVDAAISKVDSEAIANSASEALSAVGLDVNSNQAISGIVDKLKTGASIVLKGNKLSLPKIWDGSNYTPTFSVSTRLFSPYGTPKAVREFIIKPLTMILMMGIPYTEDMISYGKPFALTLRSWGTSYLTLAAITSITLQRGGNDVTFNIYKQPLSINISIEFTSLVDGISAFISDQDMAKMPEYEKRAYQDVLNILPLNSNSQNIDGSILPTLMPTLGGIIRSMQPVQIESLNANYGPLNSSRQTTMIGGGGGSGSGGIGGLGDLFGGALSSIGGTISNAFNAAYAQASESSGFLSEFGEMFNTVSETASGIYMTGRRIYSSVNSTVNSVTGLLNRVTGGAFNNTGLAGSIRKIQQKVNRANTTCGNFLRDVNATAVNINDAINYFGSLLKTPVGEKKKP